MTSAKKQKGKPSHVRNNRCLEKWHIKRTRLHLEQRTGKKNGGNDDRENDLEEQLESATDASRFFLRNLQIIIRKSERTQIKHAEQSEPDEAIVRTRPQKAGKKNGADDEHATHGRRSLLAEMQFCQPVDFFRPANRLTQLERRQLADDEVPEDQ